MRVVIDQFAKSKISHLSRLAGLSRLSRLSFLDIFLMPTLCIKSLLNLSLNLSAIFEIAIQIGKKKYISIRKSKISIHPSSTS